MMKRTMTLTQFHIKEHYVLLKMVESAVLLTKLHIDKCYDSLCIMKSTTLLAKILFIIVIIQGIGNAMSDKKKTQYDGYSK